MIRGVWVVRNGQMVPKHLAPPLNHKYADAPMVISDCMDSTVNHADGRRYDSKRAYEKAVRRAGCEIVGNEKMPSLAPPQMSDPSEDIKNAIDQIESRALVKRKRRKRGL